MYNRSDVRSAAYYNLSKLPFGAFQEPVQNQGSIGARFKKAVVVLHQFNKYAIYRRSIFLNTITLSKFFISSWHAYEQQQRYAENKNLFKSGKMVVHVFCYPVTHTHTKRH